MSLSARLALALRHHGISGAELARRIDRSRAAVNDILHGKSQAGQSLADIAKTLEVSAEWLRHGTGVVPNWALKEDKTWPYTWAKTDISGDMHIPVVGGAAAAIGAGEVSDADYEGPGMAIREGDWEGPSLQIKNHWQGIKIHGSSGEPVVLDGQTVIVDPRVTPKKNHLVVVHTDMGPVLKRFVKEDAGKMFLASINHGWDSLVVDSTDLPHLPLVVVGVVFTDGVAK